MTNNNSYIESSLKAFLESTILIERSRVETQQNTTMSNLYYDITHFDKNSPNAEENAKALWDRIQKPINTSASNHAIYTWNGTPIKSIKFLKSPKYVTIIDGEVETYKDPLWFYIDPNTKKMVSYLDQNGMIRPGYEYVIQRVNQKYGLKLDPTAPIIKMGRYDTSNNGEQFNIWKNKYYIPWYKKNSSDGASWEKLFKQYVTGELPKDEENYKPIKKEISIQNVPEEEYDRSVIEPIVTLFKNKPWVASGELNVIANDKSEKHYSSQQIYNTMIKLLNNSKDASIKGRMYDMIADYKKTHSELKGKFESVNDEKSSWLTHNGDYHIFDKLNNIFRLKKESRENNMTDKIKVLQEGNTFASINTNENEFDPSKVTSDIFNDENESALSEEEELKKNRLTKQVLDKINDTLKLNKEVQNILDEIREINNGNDYNNWVVNEEGNTATLASKNAKIFKQNLNLCLSHDNEIEVFKSVCELHQWLKDHNYPMPKNIQLHESINLKEGLENQFLGLRNWLDRIKNENSELDEDFCCGNMGDTTSASLGTALQYLYKNKKNESLDKSTFVDKLKQLKEDDTDVASSFDSAIQTNAGFGNDSSDTTSDTTSNDSLSSATSTQDDAVDLGQDGQDGAPSGFDDININTNGYGPDEGYSDEEDDNFSPVPEDEYQIIDVLADSADNIRVKVKNLTSGEYEYKDLSEIDI